MKKKIKFSNFSFYTFTICITACALIVISTTVSCLFSGYRLSPHGMFRIWMVILSFGTVAAVALFRILFDIAVWCVHSIRNRNAKGSGNQESNTENISNTINIENMEYMT